MLLTGLFVLGFWTFAWGLCGVFNKGPFTNNVSRSVTSDEEPPKVTIMVVHVKTKRYLSAVCILVGGFGLSILALVNYGFLTPSLKVLMGHDWAWYAVWILPGIIMLAILLLSMHQSPVVDESSGLTTLMP